ncbi:MAG: PAS domain S-box protein [Methylocystaceae bacterium]
MNYRMGVSGLQRHEYACLIYQQDDDWSASLVEYLSKGLNQHQRCLCILDQHHSGDLTAALAQAGVDIIDKTACGSLAIISMSDLPPDIFNDFITATAYLDNEIARALQQGFTGLRLTYEVGDFCLQQLTPEQLMLWEVQAKQHYLPSHPLLVIAQYNAEQLPPLVLMNALLTHNLLVRGGDLIPNDYTLSPESIMSPRRESVRVTQLLNKIDSDHYEDNNLRENERNSRAVEKAVLDAMINALIMIDNQGRIMVWNRAAEKIFGYRAQDVMGQQLHHLIIPTHLLDNFDHAFAYFSRTGQGPLVGKPVESVARRSDGTEFPVELSISPIKIRNSWAATGIVRDITDRKRMEQALMDSEEMFRTLVGSMDDIVFTLDQDHRLTGAFGHWLERAGVDPTAYFGKTTESLLGRFYLIHQQACALALTGESAVYEWESLVHNTLRYFQTSLSPLTDGNGDIRGIVGVGRDITEQKRLEKTLQEQLHFLQQMIDTIPTPAFFRDTNGVFQGCNKAFEQAVGQRRSKIVGKYLDKVLPKDLADKYREMDIEMMNTSSIQCYEWEFQYADGTRHVVIFNKAPFYNMEGVLLGVVGVTVDLTERKRMEQEVLRLDRLRVVGEMAAGIAHEIRNPMTTVRGFLQMMMEKTDLSPYCEYFDVMIEELDSANSIIGEFLSLAKDNTVDLQVQSLNHVIDALAPLLYAEALKCDKSIIMMPGQVPEILLDARQIRQLILNLARNGLEAMEPSGILTLSTYTQDNEVVLSIRDQGHGIDPDILPQLGTPFFTTKDQGTGLGLAVCYSIATKHNATINVETSSQGTAFIVRFHEFNGVTAAAV